MVKKLRALSRRLPCTNREKGETLEPLRGQSDALALPRICRQRWPLGWEAFARSSSSKLRAQQPGNRRGARGSHHRRGAS